MVATAPPAAPADAATPPTADAAVTAADPIAGRWVHHHKNGWGRPAVDTMTIKKQGAVYVVTVANPEGMLNGSFAGPFDGAQIAVHSPYGDITYLADEHAMLFAGTRFERERERAPRGSSAADPARLARSRSEDRSPARADGGTKRDSKDAAVLAKLEDFARQMCSCKDRACADIVNETMTKWGAEQGKPDRELARRATTPMQRYSECQLKLLRPSPQPPDEDVSDEE